MDNPNCRLNRLVLEPLIGLGAAARLFTPRCLDRPVSPSCVWRGVKTPTRARSPAVATPPRPQPQQPRDPFRRVAGPMVLILPHEAGPVPARMARPAAPVVRFAAAPAHAPAGGLVSRGQMFISGQFVPEVPPDPPPPPVTPEPAVSVRNRLRAAWRRKTHESRAG